MMKNTSLLLLFTTCLGLLGCDGSTTPPPPVELNYRRITVDADAGGPAFVDVADLNGDGRADLLVSKFGTIEGPRLPTGEITAYLQGDSLEDWTATTVLSSEEGLYWPNEVRTHDIDDDGDLDVFVGVGFLVCPIFVTVGDCGGVVWFEHDDERWIRHDIIAPGADLFYHATEFADIDQDGITDIVTVGEQRYLIEGELQDRSEAIWIRGTDDAARFESTRRVIGPGLGSLPTVIDLDNDGDEDIASAEFFAAMGASFTWYERIADPSEANPAGEWERHIIDDQSGPSIQLSFIPDLLGDGRTVAVGSNHTNTQTDPPDPWESAIYILEPSTDPTQPWTRRMISEGIVSIAGERSSPQAAPGIFGWGDAENDGDIDLIVSGDGDPRVFLLEQMPGGTFRSHVLEDSVPQAGGMKIEDLNGDGYRELVVAGYDNNAIYLYILDQNGNYPVVAAND